MLRIAASCFLSFTFVLLSLGLFKLISNDSSMPFTLFAGNYFYACLPEALNHHSGKEMNGDGAVEIWPANVLSTIRKELETLCPKCIKTWWQNLAVIFKSEQAPLPPPSSGLFNVRLTPEHKELIGLALRLLVTTGLGYLSIKWLLNQIDPTSQQKKDAKKTAEAVLGRLGIKGIQLNAYELVIAQQLIPTDSIDVDWSSIGGCDHLIHELEDAVILPLRLGNSSTLLAPPKGVLLYGPPGCGKTMLAKAVAKAAGARFINLQVSILTDKWYGESEKLAYAVFSVAKKLQPVIIFIDEIDSFLRSRQSYDHEATAMMKAQFMSHWDGFASDPSVHIVIMGATNRPRDVDAAILRRMPARYHVKLPTAPQRQAIFEVILKNERLSPDVDFGELASSSEMFSGSDIKEVCRVGAVARAKDVITRGEFLSSNSARLLNQDDLMHAVHKIRESKNLDRPALLHEALNAAGTDEDMIDLD